ALSPDGKTLLVLTSGYNLNAAANGALNPAESNEYVFVYDVTVSPPKKAQVIQVPNTFSGIAWNPTGNEFYVPGLVPAPPQGFTFLADVLFIYGNVGGKWTLVAAPVPFGHNPNPATFSLGGLGLGNTPIAAGVGVNATGSRLAVADYENDSVTVIDVAARAKV